MERLDEISAKMSRIDELSAKISRLERKLGDIEETMSESFDITHEKNFNNVFFILKLIDI